MIGEKIFYENKIKVYVKLVGGVWKIMCFIFDFGWKLKLVFVERIVVLIYFFVWGGNYMVD